MHGKQWMNSGPGRIAVTALGWTILGFVFALPSLSTGADWRHALLVSLTLWWSWGLVTPLILFADRLIETKQLSRRVLAHIVPSVLVTVVYAYLLHAMRATFGIEAWTRLAHFHFLIDSLQGMFVWNWLNFWLILGAWQAYRYYDHYNSAELRLERLQKNFSEARLHALRMQLDPHFLFNALNTVSSQVERDPKLARSMIEHLGDLLRLSLESRERQEIPLAEEMAFLEHYLAIQKIRFGDHLQIERQIAPEAKNALVPCLFIQPLVENAIRHGISRRASGGTVIVRAERSGNRLAIRVLDDGVGLPHGWTMEGSGGVGLSVTRQRLAGLYPDEAIHFDVSRRPSGGTAVEISIPLRETRGEAHAATRG